MKISRTCLVSLILIVFVLFPSISQAQISWSDLTHEQRKEYKEALEKDYKHKTFDNIWNDYLDILQESHGQWFFVKTSCEFKEPFRSSAIKEIFKKEMDGQFLLAFMTSCWQDEIISKAVEEFIKNSHSVFDLFEFFDYADGSEYDSKYVVPIVSRVMEESSIPNYILRKLIRHGSDKQKIEMAHRIIFNNPNRADLDKIALLDIEYYSELAKLMLSDKPQSNLYYKIDDFEPLTRRTILEKIMSVDPSKQ